MASATARVSFLSYFWKGTNNNTGRFVNRALPQEKTNWRVYRWNHSCSPVANGPEPIPRFRNKPATSTPRICESLPAFGRRPPSVNFHTTTASCGDVVSFLLSDIGEGIREVSVKEWFVEVGDKVNQFDPICEVQSDKASVTITSRFDGVIKKLYHELDETAFVGNPLVDIEIEGEGTGNDVLVDQVQDAVPFSENHLLADKAKRMLATPAVRRIANENNIPLIDVKGSGRDGRILKEDILEHIELLKRELSSTQSAEQTTEVAAPSKESVVPLFKAIPSDSVTASSMVPNRVEAIVGFRKAMVKTMTASLRIPHFGYADELLLNKLVELRQSVIKDLSRRNSSVRITYMPFFVKEAASLALCQYPILNSSVDDKCENIIYKSSHNIGIAMDTPKGLVVPNVKDVQSLSVLEIAIKLNRLQELGAKGKLGAEDITCGTFTLSNIGMIGGTYLKPVILPPEVVIGAIGKIQVLPRFDDRGNVYAAHIMQVSWSADHRVIDGVTMANFSTLWKSYLESPGTMLLSLT